MTTQPWGQTPNPSAGRVLGTAGGGLVDAAWLAAKDKGAAKIGRDGEIRTAALLNKYAAMDGGVTVLHDLKVPSAKYKANIDHVVVSGNTVHVIDAKVWKPAFYWTLGEKTRRGMARFEPAEKQTMVVIANALAAHFDRYGVKADLPTPLLFVWPSSKNGSLNTSFLKVPGATVVAGPKVAPLTDRLFTPKRSLVGGGKGRPADPQIVAALAILVNGFSSGRSGFNGHAAAAPSW